MSTDTAPAQTMHAGRFIARRLSSRYRLQSSRCRAVSIYDGQREEGIRLDRHPPRTSAAFAAGRRPGRSDQGWAWAGYYRGAGDLTDERDGGGPATQSPLRARRSRYAMPRWGGRAPAGRLDHAVWAPVACRYSAKSAENAGLSIVGVAAAVSAPVGKHSSILPMDHAFSMSSDTGRPGALTELLAGPAPQPARPGPAAGLFSSTAQRPVIARGRHQRSVGP